MARSPSGRRDTHNPPESVCQPVPRKLSKQVAVGAGHLTWLRRSACSVRVFADFSPELVVLGCREEIPALMVTILP